MSRLFALGLLVLPLAACGGEELGQGEFPTGQVINNVQPLATGIGCSGFELVSTTGLGYKETGNCQLGGQQLGLYAFSTGGDRRAFVTGSRPPEADFVPGRGVYVVGDYWVVEAPTRELAQQVQTRTEGQIL